MHAIQIGQTSFMRPFDNQLKRLDTERATVVYFVRMLYDRADLFEALDSTLASDRGIVAKEELLGCPLAVQEQVGPDFESGKDADSIVSQVCVGA